jgi:predicted TIM-barrel fold metal-dependent hydrolase
MILDAFNHFTPKTVFERFKEAAPNHFGLQAFGSLPALWDIDVRLKLVDQYADYQQVLSLGNPPIEVLGSPETSLYLAQLANDELAAVCTKYPDQFPAFTASLPMNDPDAAVKEAERAISTLGARGIQIYTNILGQPLSLSKFTPLFDFMASCDLPVLIHPARGADFADYSTENASENEIWFTFGWPYETTACVTRLIYSGLFDRLPTIKILTHHMGGMIPYFADKIALGFMQIFHGEPGRNPLAEKAGLKKQPIDYYHMLYGDTALNGSLDAMRCGHAFFGTDRSIFATDAPFDSIGGHGLIGKSITAVNSLEVDSPSRARIFHANARSLFHLDRV